MDQVNGRPNQGRLTSGFDGFSSGFDFVDLD